MLWLPAMVPALAWSATGTDSLAATADRIRPLFLRKKPPQPGDWLTQHDEPGQSYAQFRATTGQRAIDRYDTLRVVLVGSLTRGQVEVFRAVTDYLTPFFGLNVVIDPHQPTESLPASAWRPAGGTGHRQLHTMWLLEKLLRSRRRARDAAVLGLTAFDLWPGPGWNFVFGQASLSERVGVWSMARNGEADGAAALRRVCALRTAMTATHEVGHMFGIRHCIAYECGMNGSNHVGERDRAPLEFCPECQPKLWWTLHLDPTRRSRALAAVARRNGHGRVARDFERQLATLEASS